MLKLVDILFNLIILKLIILPYLVFRKDEF